MARREDILDAAITLVGENGMRSLTHRAVDTTANVPAGTTSNYFRTRRALIGGVVERFAARERAGWDEMAATDYPRNAAELATALAAFVQRAVGPQRTVTLARFAILVEAAIHPEIREQVAGPGMRVRSWATTWAKAIGSRHPERDARIIGAAVDGMVLHQLYNPDPEFDPTERLSALLTALIPNEQVPNEQVPNEQVPNEQVPNEQVPNERRSKR